MHDIDRWGVSRSTSLRWARAAGVKRIHLPGLEILYISGAALRAKKNQGAKKTRSKTRGKGKRKEKGEEGKEGVKQGEREKEKRRGKKEKRG